MNNFWTIFKFNYKDTVISKFFFISTAIILALLIGIIFVIPLFSDAEDEVKVIKIIDPNNLIAEEKISLFFGTSFDFQKENQLSIENAKKELLDKENKKLYGVLVIGNSFQEVELLLNDASYQQYGTVYSTVLSGLQTSSLAKELSDLGINLEQINSSIKGINVVNVSKEKIEEEAVINNPIYSFGLNFIMYLAILLYGLSPAMSIVKDKDFRVMETFITSVKPKELILGKILGMGLGGLTQVAIIFGGLFSCIKIADILNISTAIDAGAFQFPLYIVIYGIIFFLLGFLLYATIFTIFGCFASKTEDLSNISFPLQVPIIFSYIVGMMASSNPDLTILKVCSYIPFTSPIIMFARICATKISIVEIIISIVITIISIYAFAILTAKIYKIGLLMYGKAPSIKEFFKLFRDYKV